MVAKVKKKHCKIIFYSYRFRFAQETSRVPAVPKVFSLTDHCLIDFSWGCLPLYSDDARKNTARS